MARPRKLTLDEQLKNTQEEYIQTRKRCDELAKEIERLSKLKREEMTNQLLDAMAKSEKSFDEILAFINGGSAVEED